MNDQMGSGSLLDTTDSLEAVGVFRGWKNLMFLIVFLCLLLTQGAFWLVNTGLVEAKCDCCIQDPDAAAVAVAPVAQDANEAVAVTDPNAPVADAADSEADQAQAPQSVLNDILDEVTSPRLCLALRLTNAILILSACIYLLTILFSLKVSIVGKLGGINHISRAFFAALFMFVLLLPWQSIFDGMVVGAVFTPCELMKWASVERLDLLDNVLYYLRFSGYWLLIFFMLIITQMRTCRWTGAILRRLEVV